MKKLLICIAVLFTVALCFSCSSKSNQTEQKEVKEARPDSVLYKVSKECFDQIVWLKSTNDFVKNGSSSDGYRSWVRKALSFTDEENHIADSLFGFVPKDIYYIGQEYSIFKGKETDKTLAMVKKFYNIFYPLSDSVEVIGLWRLTSNISPQVDSRLFIYKKGSKLFCKENHEAGGEKIVALRKDGSKYYDTESSFGEYFLITGDVLRLFDKDGEYGGGSGYTITSLKE